MEAKLSTQLRIVEAKVNRYFSRMQQMYESRSNLDSRTKLKAFKRQALELDHIYENFEKVFEEGIRIQADANPDFVPDYRPLDKFEEMYYEIKDLLGVMEKDSSPERAGQSMTAEARPRLPKIDLMEFDGDPLKWPVFVQTFQHLVHDNSSLDPVSKMHYLMGKLKGKALSVVAGIIPTAENYAIAWDALVRRYEDKRALAGAYLGQILEAKPVTQENVEQLSSFIDRVDAAVRSLRQLQIGDLGDFILTSICLSKIDAQSRLLFERSLERNHFPEFEQLADFLKEQCRILARTTEGFGKLTKSGKTTHWKSFAVREGGTPLEKPSLRCEFCRSEGHNIYKCPKFVSLAYMERKRFAFKRRLCFNCLRSGHSGADCQSASTCTRCKAKHHTLLHREDSKSKDEEGEPREEAIPVTMVSTDGEDRRNRTVLLSTASVWLNAKHAERVPMRLLLDSGSQCNFITKEFCRKWQLPVRPVVATVSGIGADAKRVRGKAKLTFRSRFHPDEYELEAWVIDQITEKLPSVEIDPKIYQRLWGQDLADESFATPGPIDGLVGAELVPKLLGPGKSLGEGWPTAIESPLGLVLMGNAPVSGETEEYRICCYTELNELLQKFWALEDVEERPALNPDEVACEELFAESVQRGEDGRFTVALPFQEYPPDLGDSYSMARKRLLNLEGKFARWPDYGKQYGAVIQDYLEQGHMRLAKPAMGLGKSYYIPHHGVLKASSTSTPLRVVFDASAVSSNGRSLNDTMFVGPKLQTDIFEVLVRFRIWEIAMTADVKQMYRQIGVCEEHRVFQRVLWRFNQEEPIQTYELTTVTFGVKASPFLALRTVKQLAMEESENFPWAARRIERELYMDDVVSSVATPSEAWELYRQWVGLFKTGGFQLTKWATNSASLLEQIPLEARRAENVTFPTDVLTVLGLRWFTEFDELRFKVELKEVEWNKRSVLSTMARMWDPLGFLTPVTVAVKLLMKRLWSLNLEWDEALPSEVLKGWLEFVRELPVLGNARFPRHLGVSARDVVRLVGFADASEKAYAAVIYLLVERADGARSSRLVCAKAKVAPTKVLSIPRLELCGVLLLAKLLRKILGLLQGTLKISGVHAFTDSTVVLHWLRGSPHRWKAFVANRVTKVKEYTPEVQWGHVRSEDNPADCASRGLLPKEFLENALWLEGPKWVCLPPDQWPRGAPKLEIEGVDLEERPEPCLTGNISKEPLGELIMRSSSWEKMLRITIYVLRFAGKLSRGETITASDYTAAEVALIKFVQQFHFEELIEKLKASQPLEKKFLVLTPFLLDGVVRVGGRLRNTKWRCEQRHPILLPKDSQLTILLINYVHVKYLHAGPTFVDGFIRRRYWIVGARDVIRRQLHGCVKCFRCKPTFTHPMMADLTPARVAEVKAFVHTGVDFAGPFKITLSRHRGVKATKGYFCIFTCLTTRAVHLEAASDLSADCCLAAIKRFVARRGPCSVFYSDQGTNFVGVKNRLDELEEFLASEDVKKGLRQTLNQQRIEWRLNPPAAPHFGGAWEAGVKSVKYHLTRVVGDQILTFEEFTTLLCEVEAVLNSRPLSWLSPDPSDPVALTPAHFLTLSPLQEIPTSDLDQTIGPGQRSSLIRSMVQSYWKRWRQEYLATLQKRMKWNTPACPVQPGVMVVVQQENVPPLRWALGRIEEVYPGKDGVIRVALVKTKSGSFKRPVVRLAPLPISY